MSFLKPYLRYSESNVTLIFYVGCLFKFGFGLRFGETLCLDGVSSWNDIFFGGVLSELDFRGFVLFTLFPFLQFHSNLVIGNIHIHNVRRPQHGPPKFGHLVSSLLYFYKHIREKINSKFLYKRL